MNKELCIKVGKLNNSNFKNLCKSLDDVLSQKTRAVNIIFVRLHQNLTVHEMYTPVNSGTVLISLYRNK